MYSGVHRPWSVHFEKLIFVQSHCPCPAMTKAEVVQFRDAKAEVAKAEVVQFRDLGCTHVYVSVCVCVCVSVSECECVSVCE